MKQPLDSIDSIDSIDSLRFGNWVLPATAQTTSTHEFLGRRTAHAASRNPGLQRQCKRTEAQNSKTVTVSSELFPCLATHCWREVLLGGCGFWEDIFWLVVSLCQSVKSGNFKFEWEVRGIHQFYRKTLDLIVFVGLTFSHERGRPHSQATSVLIVLKSNPWTDRAKNKKLMTTFRVHEAAK